MSDRQSDVAKIVEAGQVIEGELTYQADRLETVVPSTEEEAVYLTDLKNGYRQAAVYVNRMWTHQRKRLDRIQYDAESPYADLVARGLTIDKEGRAIAHTGDGE